MMPTNCYRYSSTAEMAKTVCQAHSNCYKCPLKLGKNSSFRCDYDRYLVAIQHHSPVIYEYIQETLSNLQAAIDASNKIRRQ